MSFRGAQATRNLNHYRISPFSRNDRTDDYAKVLKGMVQGTLLFFLFICVGCAPKLVEYKPVTLPRPPQETQAAEEKPTAVQKKELPGLEVLTTPTFEKPEEQPSSEKKPPVKEPIYPKRIGLAQGEVTINAEKMPLSDFIIYALGETLKISFVMDEKTMNDKQAITFRMPQAMASDKALEIVLGLFEKYGLYVEERAGALYILSKTPQAPPADPYKVRFGRSITDVSTEVLQVVPLKHTAPIEIEPLLREISKTTIQIKPLKGNMLQLYGRGDQIKKVLDVLEIFDVPYFENKKLFLLRFTYIKPDEFINEIKTVLTGLGFRIASLPNEAGILFLPVKYLNALLMVSPDDKTAKYVLEWKEKLDTAETGGTEERSFTFSPQYSKATDLVKSIQSLYGIGGFTDSKTGLTKPAAAIGAGLPDAKISADDGKNIILIIGTPAAYKKIHILLNDLDTPPKQCLIEATIVELTLTDELKYGLEWYIRNSQEGGQYILGTLGHLGLSPLGLSYQFVSQTGSVQALVSALATQNRANILSTPRLMVLDNKEATIQIGTDVPTVTSQITSAEATTATTSNVLQSISYRNTGVMLRVKPTVNAEGLMTLEIGQEVSQPGAAGVGNSPLILTRRINTTVIVGNGQTIALGGLFKDNEGAVDTKVPLLGDIPLLGNLFKYTAKTKEKTELLILVTPTILMSTDDSVKITGELKKELKWFK